MKQKTIEFGQEFKPVKVDINKDDQELFNQNYINDLTKIIKTNSTVPTHTPRKLIDCFYLRWDGSNTYELYVYINNSWKKTSLT